MLRPLFTVAGKKTSTIPASGGSLNSDIISGTENTRVGLVLDTFHMNMEDDDICTALREAADTMIHFQANENHRGYLGTGHIDWNPVVRTLADIGYRGTISLEPFRRRDERIGIPFAQWKAPVTDEAVELRAACGFLKNLITLNGGRQ